MTDPSSDTPAPQAFAKQQDIVARALEHVRAVFKGNGIKADKIRIASHKIALHTMNAGTYLELKPVLNELTMPGKGMVGQVTGSRAEAMRAVDQSMVHASRDSAAQAQIAAVLLARSDQGFGLSRQAIPIEFLKREFTWYEACHTCKGSAQAPCQRCQGRRLETCTKCTGRGLMPCPLCRATGLLQGNKCNRCHGQRYVPCDGCQRSGMMGCRMCNRTGVMRCATCAGQGWKSHILSLAPQALTYFEYDPKTIPKGAADAFAIQPAALAATGKVKIKGRAADDKEDALGASYEVEFPYGEIVFQLGKREVKTHLFGYAGDFVDFPFVLDKMLAPTVQELEEAANNVGSVADTIKNVTRFRLIAQAFLYTLKTNPKKTAAQLTKTYDIGLSLGMAERIATLAHLATARITKKPRWIGLFTGLVLTAAINAGYYLLPLRAPIAAQLPDRRIDILLDIVPVVLGGGMTMLAVQLVAAQSIRKALGHLIPAGKKQSLMPRLQTLHPWIWGGAVLLTAGAIGLAAMQGAPLPYWVSSAAALIGR